MAVEYDRELIACMLEMSAGCIETFNETSMREQARLLRDADNAAAARVGTARAGGGDVTDEMVERAAKAYCHWFNGREGVNTLALRQALAAALSPRTAEGGA